MDKNKKMSAYITYRDGQILELQTPYQQFKAFKKDFNQVVSDGYSVVYQRMTPETTVVSKMSFAFDEQLGFDIVDNDVIGQLVYVHQEVVSQLVPNIKSSDLVCFVMTHPQIETDEFYVEEVYFQFPYIKASVESMKNKLLPNLRHFFTETAIHENMEILPANDINSILSGDIYNNGVWPLPGSYINGNLLTITHVFDKITQEQVQNSEIIGYPPEAYFSNLEIPDNQDYDSSNSFYFSNLNGFIMNKKKKTQREKNRDLTQKLIEERQRETKRTPGELCKIFVDMLNPARFVNKIQREKLGQVLFNVLKASEQGLKIWIDAISYKFDTINKQKPSKEQLVLEMNLQEQDIQIDTRMEEEELYREIKAIQEECMELWDYMEYTESTIGTLRYWAKIDNPEQYKAFVKKDVTTLAWKCLNKTSAHTDVAKLVYAKYSEQFACAHIKDNLWFGYWHHRWHELDTGHALRIKLSEEMPQIFEKILNECNSEYKKAIGDEDKEKWATLMTTCVRMIKDLKTVAYKNNIMKECAEKFYDPDFVQKLDENRVLLGMPNGVYELETDTFRPGKPEDFITLSTKAKWNDNYSWEHPRIKQVVYYMKTVYPDRELRHYVQKSFGTILEGGNMNKDFYNMIGDGDNSKSMVAKLLKLTMGKYVSKIPVSMIMGKRGQAGNATPNLADKKGIRALFVEEPPRGQSNVSVVKELSGNDDILTRALFKMPIIFSPQWKLYVFTNHLLEADAEEKAYWNRQKVIDHESTFTFDAPELIEDQFRTKMFPRDPFFDRKLKEMAEPMFWCQKEWYKMFKQEGLKPPQRVVEATQAAKLRNDVYMQYIGDSLDNGTQHDVMTVDAMYEDFKTWYNNAFVGRGLPDKFYFEDEMSKVGHLGNRPINKRWFGIKFKQKITVLPTFGNQKPNVSSYGNGGYAPNPFQMNTISSGQRLVTAT